MRTTIQFLLPGKVAEEKKTWVERVRIPLEGVREKFNISENVAKDHDAGEL